MHLYPYLPRAVARSLAEVRASEAIENLRLQTSDRSSLVHRTAQYAPTGGHRVDLDTLADLRQNLRSLAQICGYPDIPTVGTRTYFDLECTRLLFEKMRITPSEAANLYIWAHMTCVLVPDVVRWRFIGEDDGTSVDRFIGGARGMRRNALGRLWWRAYLLTDTTNDDPYHLLRQLTEDDIVQITERPSIAGSRNLALRTATAFLNAQRIYPDIPPRQLVRDAMKRINRLLPMLEFDALDSLEVDELLRMAFGRSAEALIGNPDPASAQ